MNENLDLTKILKDCPKGTKFYSSYLGTDVFFIEIDNTNCIKCEYTSQIDFLNSIIHFKKDASLYPGGECMLFPSKDQHDWLKWHRPFVDGDVVYIKAQFDWIIIKKDGEYITRSYVECDPQNKTISIDSDYVCEDKYIKEIRFATEEEKATLFQVIKDNGYKWDPETKTLEKLIVPKFKVGDRIRKKGECRCGIIKCIDSDNFYKVEYSGGAVSFVNVKYQNEYELAPNKFDPQTLQPFDKVLVRRYDVGIWCVDFYSYYDEVVDYAVCTSGVNYGYCIPYNDETKHLVGKRDNAPEFYRYWEE